MKTRTPRWATSAVLLAFAVIALATGAPGAAAATDSVLTPNLTAAAVADTAAPTAVLDAPSVVAFGSSIPLSGARSFDSGGGQIVQYRWTVSTRPVVVTAGSSFTAAPLPLGRHTISLVVVDNSGNVSTASTRDVIVRDEVPPTAVLDAPATAAFGSSIPLSGARSTDGGGGRIVEYRWTVSTRPVAVTDTSTFNAAPLPLGKHTISLVVIDDAGNQSTPSTKEVVVRDETAPTAVLDAPSVIASGAAIPLSGTRSTDGGGGKVVQYRWTVAGRPVVVTADSTFNAPGLPPGRHAASLVVVDDAGNQSTPDTKEIVVRDETAPTAALDAPSAAAFGSSIPLSGERSTDAGGGRIVQYRWTVSNRPVVVTDTSSFTAAPLPLGRHTISLVVVDDSGNQSTPSTKDVVVRDEAAPTAVLDAPATAAVGATIPLSGARSSDTGGGRVVNYRWTVANRPVVVTADPTFNAPGLSAGRHQVSLVVTDDAGNQSSPDAKTVEVGDVRAPTPVLDAPATVAFGASIPLSGARSTDVGGRIVRYRWKVADRAPVETSEPSFTAAALPLGRHEVSLVATDDSGNESAADTKSVVVRDEQAPTAVLDAPASVPAGAAIPLSGARSSDGGGGRVVRYRWTVAGRPAVETADAAFSAPALPAGRHQVSLVVTDDSGNDSSPAANTVEVLAAATPPSQPEPPAPTPPTGRQLGTFGPATLIAPAGAATAQIDLGRGTLTAGHIFSPVATVLTVDFSTTLPTGGARASAKGKRLALGKKTLTVPAGDAKALSLKLSAKVRKTLKGRKKLKVLMRVTARESASGQKTTTSRTLTFSIKSKR